VVTTQQAYALQINVKNVGFYETTDSARLIIDLDSETTFSYFALSKPNRIVIDLIDVSQDFDLSKVSLSGSSVSKVRYSTPKSRNDSRIVIETNKSLNTMMFALAPFEKGNPSSLHRLIVEMTDSSFSTASASKPVAVSKSKVKSPSGNKFSSTQALDISPQSKFSVRDPSLSNASSANPTVSKTPVNTAPVVTKPLRPATTASIPNRDKDILIVIDAGHGGVDPGSIGPAGTYEKNITLSISKMLAKKINAEPGLRAILTRDGDYYISPNDRPKIAVKENADLLVSIHADAFTTSQPRGGSVWVLSKGRADSELGRLIEQTERSSELLGPAADVIEDRDTERYFAETILNMSMDLFRALSYELSHEIIKDMQGVTKLHKKVPQSASLAVLTAAETPSILVEVGFISNPQEEKNLNWAKHRQRLAESLFSSIKRYFKKTPPDGTLWAQHKNNEPILHRIARDESLSVVAQRYGVSVRDLKQENGLKSDLVRIGQILTIPR
jgi:N-acetylmuramoyl-L-alanine amidase